ncbi:unnamed protein product [Kuraishia capsulata CBS 1993]|uniref:Ceramide glucosyltransferase n=1 Tax=Kuraishia capsulata CBS 1993 TaxID=1382522 RepID=W6MLS1_9ASCO|nr:uncharacterized protein KUCA_T00003050001 [Kuraishia capsulata CBS 1993]CDK27073.1 unnamed protein product [Kuraishia capsulata CBS 1993]
MEESFSYGCITWAVILFIWYVVVLSLASYGFFGILAHSRSKVNNHPQNLDHSNLDGVTILRPLKGLDPEMETCLRCAFTQNYPAGKLEILFCIENATDPATEVAKKIVAEFPHIDSKILIGDSGLPDYFGPNPKINNLAKGYARAKYDIVWVLDSNVWVGPNTLERSVFALKNSTNNGKPTHNFSTKKGRRVNLVHHTPLAVAVEPSLGALCDEMFLSTSHAKFYVSLNNVAVAPCVNGKSNLYRRTELDEAVRQIGLGYLPSNNGQSGEEGPDAAFFGKSGQGIRFFARYIGEDNMIGIALWNKIGACRTAMTGDCAVQPVTSGSNGGLKSYVERRVRWLRVRKYMVMAATLLEPTTECFVSGVYGTFAVSVLFFGQMFNLWWFVFHVLTWVSTDYYQFHFLHMSAYCDHDMRNCSMPYFVHPTFDVSNENTSPSSYRKLAHWLPIWLLRESLALPIWVIAIMGQEIDWRGQPFRIRADLTAERL